MGWRYYKDIRVGDSFALGSVAADSVRIDVEDFEVELDEEERIRDYVCLAALRKGDGVLLRHRIRPNHPLRWEDREIYLISFEEVEDEPEALMVTAYDRSGEPAAPHIIVPVGTAVYVEELSGTVKAELGFAPVVRLTHDDGRVETHIIKRSPSELEPGSYGFVLVQAIPSLWVRLEVVREPGQVFVMTGLALLTAGTFIGLYLSHRRLWFIVSPLPGGRARVVMGGRANRNRAGFASEFGQVRSALYELS
jgi:cytochrome c biogenesis protein ResB